mgnify:FL=1
MKENSTLYAEADGVVLALNYAEGSTTSIDNLVIAIGESNKILAEVNVSQNDITKIEEGQDVYMLWNKAITLKDGKQVVNLRQKDGTLKELEITTGFSD